jgi:branched-subunit amino acid aminotransferase/4-amino-4-deoxychorismate lyase
LRVEEKTLRPEDLWGAEEVFITSSTREVQAVAAIGERELRQGPWTGRVGAAFRQVVQEYVAAHTRGAAAKSGETKSGEPLRSV